MFYLYTSEWMKHVNVLANISCHESWHQLGQTGTLISGS